LNLLIGTKESFMAQKGKINVSKESFMAQKGKINVSKESFMAQKGKINVSNKYAGISALTPTIC